MNNQPKARNISTYVPPSRQLTGHPPLTNEEAATLVVHELHERWQTFRHTRLREDMMAFIERAVYLQHLGFELQLDKRCDCVCAHKKGAPPWTHVH